MKRQFQKLFTILITLCMAFVMVIGIGSISVAAAEEESTLSLSLVGNSTIYLQKGTEYKEFGATAYDTIEGDLTESIVINNTVNKDTVGTYTVSYSVSNASSQTASASRAVIVYEDINNEELNSKLISSSSSTNAFSKVIQTSDGGFVAYGQTYNGSYYLEIIVKYNSDFIEEWYQTLYRSRYNYAKDILEDENGNLILLSYETYYGRAYLSIIDAKDGSIRNGGYNFGTYTYTSIKEISENEYAVCSSNGENAIVYLTVNLDDYTITKKSIHIDGSLYNACIINDYVYSFNNEGVTKYNINSFAKEDEKQVQETISSFTYCTDGNIIYFCAYYDGINTIYKIDENLNIISSVMIKGEEVNAIDISQKIIVAKIRISLISE